MHNENQRILMRYQRTNLIESESSSSDEDDLKIIDQISLMKRKDDFLQNYVDDKIRYTLEHFRQKAFDLTTVDQRIIAGIVFRSVRQSQIRDEADEAAEQKKKNEAKDQKNISDIKVPHAAIISSYNINNLT